MARLLPPRRLTPSDPRAEFSSGAEELDEWFHRYAGQNDRAGNCVTYVCTLDDGSIAGFYTLSAGGVARAEAPTDLAKGRPRSIPAILLGRLAVDRRVQGCGVGRSLLTDAVSRCLVARTHIGAALMVVHCRDERARQFYLANGDFRQSPLRELQLVLPLGRVRRG